MAVREATTTRGLCPPCSTVSSSAGFRSRFSARQKPETSHTTRGVLEVPFLNKRLLRPFAGRRIWSDSRLERPELLHALHDQMVDLALALSDIGQVPYVQTVAGFATVERGLRLSRQWCRRLIAQGPDLADELAYGLGVPPEAIALIPEGVVAQSRPSRKPAAARFR